MIRSLLLLSALLVISYGPTWEQQPVVVSSTGTRLCVKHRVPLVTVAGYATPPDYVDPMRHTDSDSYKLYFVMPFPNRIPDTQSLKRTPGTTVPTHVTYCPKCQEEYDEARQIII